MVYSQGPQNRNTPVEHGVSQHRTTSGPVGGQAGRRLGPFLRDDLLRCGLCRGLQEAENNDAEVEVS